MFLQSSLRKSNLTFMERRAIVIRGIVQGVGFRPFVYHLAALLAGVTATVDSIKQDFEGRVYLAVPVDDDPGRDLGALRQPGHRFFFQPDEVEPL